MSDYVPTIGEVRDSLVYLNKYHAKQYGDVDLLVVGSETAAQFDRMIAEVERAAAEKAVANVRSEIRQIPRWWNPELGYGEFDLQPLGPNETSEKGAYMEVMRVLDDRAAALGLTAGQEGKKDE